MKTINRITILLTMASMVFMTSCEGLGVGCIHGNNRIAMERRPVSSFNAVESDGSFVVEVTTGISTAFLEVEGDENLLAYIETFVQGDRLILKTKRNKCIRSNTPIKIRVSTSDVRALKLAGSGAIYCDHINSDELYIDLPGSGIIECRELNLGYVRVTLSGSGNIELWGNASESELTLSGSGLIRTINLAQNTCYANISGSGNIYADVSEKLDVTISGSGNLYYSGNPVITQSISGSGSVRRYQ